jgi:CelD/BcsL family acetyltransferase involved in cellulose biosynthesis
MTAIDLASGGELAAMGAGAPVARSFESLAAARDLWLRLEAKGEATPYQTFAFSDAWMSSIGAAEGWRAWPLLVSTPAGEPLALLPLAVRRRMGVNIGAFLGGKHANFTMPLYAQGARRTLAPDALRAAAVDAARRGGVDLLLLERQVTGWMGTPNPLARLDARPAASQAYKATLVADGDAFMQAIMSSESRKKLRHKEKKLSEFGAVAFREAGAPDERRRALEAFLAQKAQRFAALGIDNPFADPAAEDFLRRATQAGDASPVRLFALFSGNRIVSVFGGAIHGGRFTGMFTSFDPDPSFSRYSPGDLLLVKLIKEMCARGLACFDLGAGEAAYKGDYCREVEELADGIVPATMKGRLAALLIAGAADLKRRLKGDARAMAAIAGLRRLRSGVRS